MSQYRPYGTFDHCGASDEEDMELAIAAATYIMKVDQQWISLLKLLKIEGIDYHAVVALTPLSYSHLEGVLWRTYFLQDRPRIDQKMTLSYLHEVLRRLYEIIDLAVDDLLKVNYSTLQKNGVPIDLHRVNAVRNSIEIVPTLSDYLR